MTLVHYSSGRKTIGQIRNNLRITWVWKEMGFSYDMYAPFEEFEICGMSGIFDVAVGEIKYATSD